VSLFYVMSKAFYILSDNGCHLAMTNSRVPSKFLITKMFQFIEKHFLKIVGRLLEY